MTVKDESKQTLLHVAATGAMARFFIEAGAEVDARDEVRTTGRVRNGPS